MIHHSKALEKCYSMMIIWKTKTETLPSKNPENPKNNPKTWYVSEKIFTNDDILYIGEKFLKSSND